MYINYGAPVQKPSRRKQKKIEALAKIYSNTKHSRNWVARTLSHYSEELLEEMMSRDISDKGMWLVKQSVNSGYNEEAIRERLIFFPYFDTSSYAMADDFVQSLHTYSQLPDDLASAGTEVIEQCHALRIIVGVCQSMPPLSSVFHERDLSQVLLADNDLIDLILTDSGDVERIADIIRRRNTTDAALIREVMNSPALAIDSGIL